MCFIFSFIYIIYVVPSKGIHKKLNVFYYKIYIYYQICRFTPMFFVEAIDYRVIYLFYIYIYIYVYAMQVLWVLINISVIGFETSLYTRKNVMHDCANSMAIKNIYNEVIPFILFLLLGLDTRARSYTHLHVLTRSNTSRNE